MGCDQEPGPEGGWLFPGLVRPWLGPRHGVGSCSLSISLRIFQFVVNYTVKGFGIFNKAEVDVLLELSCFFNELADVGNLISGFFAFLKSSLYLWKISVHVLLKPNLKDFENCLVNM